jgi:methylthioribose-1-phosphate isomerase
MMTACDAVVDLLQNLTDESSLRQEVCQFVQKLVKKEIEMNDSMAKFGASLIKHGEGILTHCNTGSLATPGKGTALGVIKEAHLQNKHIHVYVDETRPLLQGARLTAYELQKAGIPYTLICDNMAASLMKQGKINRVLVGADRIAMNGDSANKIGTYRVIHTKSDFVVRNVFSCNCLSFPWSSFSCSSTNINH